MYKHEQDWYTPLDPNDRPRPQLQPARLWPWVVSGLFLALGLWAYLEPMPLHTTLHPVAVGPNSPLYGTMQGGVAIPLAPMKE